ncbi:MAG: dihydrofolate reductase family protein, partial [Acidobacteriota bacterium]|nr:dihydrofolate reductase family protein [Acidobacteriota bacterium]
ASLDGRIATRTGESKWITGGAARRRARILRRRRQAVLVGINTVLADDPHLGSHTRGAPDPWRIVLDSRLRIPIGARVIRSGRCIVATTQAASVRKRESLRRAGAEVWVFRGQRVPLLSLLRKLPSHGILSVMVEGGGEVLGSFFDRKLPDRVCWFLSPRVIGSTLSRAAVAGRGAARLSEAKELKDVSVERVGNCWLLRGKASRWALS